MPNLTSYKKTAILVLILFLIIFVYSLFQIKRIAPNLYFAGQLIGSQDPETVKGLISKRIADFEESPVTLNIDGKTLEMSLGDLGIDIDDTGSFAEVASFGNSRIIFRDSQVKIKSLFVKSNFDPIYYIDFAKFSNTINSKLALVDKPSSNATIGFGGGNFVTIQEKVGSRVDQTSLILTLKANINSLSSSPITLNSYQDEPLIKEAQAQKALEKVKVLASQKVTLVFLSDKWTLSGKNLLDILEFSPTGYEGDYLIALNLPATNLTLKSVSLKESEAPILDVGLNNFEIESFVSSIAKLIDQATVDASLRFENGKIYDFKPAQDGRELNQELTKKILTEKVSIENLSIEKEITINMPVSITRAKIQNEEINSLGINELIGRGISYFAGSIPNRIHNVGLGATRINGILVKPGETFSFNGTVGEVSAVTGYKQAYVISQGRTILDDGGGICQVSTTLFRAALNSGLPIVARTAHAYRVGYYEQSSFKPGLDATVWSPSVDFKFKNDTSAHILVQSIFDRANAKLEIDIYGTGDGRKVELSQPVITDRKSAPEPRYQDDPTLPKGQTKQVDFAAEGAKVNFSRKVFRGSDLIIDEIFKSNFRPWQAVYLVGTGG